MVSAGEGEAAVVVAAAAAVVVISLTRLEASRLCAATAASSRAWARMEALERRMMGGGWDVQM